jgi:DNA-binding beta-propeller fold protein YncE
VDRRGSVRALKKCTATWIAGALALVASWAPSAQAPPVYRVYVASEAADRITLLRFDGSSGRIEREIDTGVMPTDIDGPHGLAVSPDKRFFYVSLAHGQPFGSVLKYSTATHAVVGRVTLGMFPATLQTTPDGDFLYVANFNLHGDHVPSSVSVVATGPMVEAARLQTCRMPHGSRLDPTGARQYSVCMMDDILTEADTHTLRVSRHFILTRGAERGLTGAPAPAAGGAAHAGHGTEPPAAGSQPCSPTWAQPSADGRAVFVACNGTSEIVEILVGTWSLGRRWTAGAGVYNLAVTPDGRSLIATNRRAQSVSVYDLATGAERARLPTSRRVVHGVVVSPDARYAFVSVEGIADEPGTVEMIDLTTLSVVARVDVAAQAGGLDVLDVR